MKVLQFCFRLPFPLNDGGAIAMYNMAKGFVENGVDLEILSYNTTKHHVNLSQVNDTIYSLDRVYEFPIDNAVKPVDALLNLFSTESYNIKRFESEEMKTFIRQTFKGKHYDVVHFEGLFTAPYLDLLREVLPNAKMVLRQHNIEYKIWERMAEGASFPKNIYLNILTARLKKYEQQLLPQFDAIVPITEVDALQLKAFNCSEYEVSSTGVDVEKFDKVEIKQKENTIGFLGSLDWMPNQEGVKWFLENVWFFIRQKAPQIHLNIAGKNAPDWLLALNNTDEQVHIIGLVDSAEEFLKEQEVIIVPLLSGSGMRIKIIEAMAAKKAIVSTTVGAEGIAITDECVLQDDAEQFADAIISLINNKDEKKLLEERAYQLALSGYSNQSKVKELIQYYKKLIK
jgi:glycosyltransferase involved in cell wall biosynthesis